jgi:mono/diheme cytochrome c family protein
MAMLTLTIGPALASADVGHGQYLAVLGDCAGCHTNGGQPAYSGGRAFSAGGKHLYPALPIA